jgi:hypothetical protein
MTLRALALQEIGMQHLQVGGARGEHDQAKQ